jgi:hypothetical protein
MRLYFNEIAARGAQRLGLRRMSAAVEIERVSTSRDERPAFLVVETPNSEGGADLSVFGEPVEHRVCPRIGTCCRLSIGRDRRRKGKEGLRV